MDSLSSSRISSGICNAATIAENNKTKKYKDLLSSYIFKPIACCTLGSWGTDSLKFIKEIEKRISNLNEDPRAGYFLRQRLSVAVARGNYTSIVETLGAIRTL